MALWDMKVGKKVQKGISDSDDIKYYLCVRLCKQEVAIPVPTGISILFSFSSFLLLYQQW